MKGHRFCLIGDAYKNPDFYQGIGTNAALIHAILVAALLIGHIDLEHFNEISKAIGAEQLESTTIFEESFKRTIKYDSFLNSLKLKLDDKIEELENKKEEKSKTSIYAPDIEQLEKAKLILLTAELDEVEGELLALEKEVKNSPTLFKQDISASTRELIESTRQKVTLYIRDLKLHNELREKAKEFEEKRSVKKK